MDEENIFSVNMTSSEARTAFYRAVDGKTAEEIEILKAEYVKILPAILKREFKLAEEGWFID